MRSRSIEPSVPKDPRPHVVSNCYSQKGGFDLDGQRQYRQEATMVRIEKRTFDQVVEQLFQLGTKQAKERVWD